MNLMNKPHTAALKSLYAKTRRAAFTLECGRPRALINLDSYENTVLHWALQGFAKFHGIDLEDYDD